MTEKEAWSRVAVFIAYTEKLADDIDLRIPYSTRRQHYRRSAAKIKAYLPTALEALDTLNPDKRT